MTSAAPAGTVLSQLVVFLAAGGTAGHVQPALTVADALRAHGARVRFIGTPKGLEGWLVPQRGYELHLVEAVAMPRGHLSGWLPLVPRLLSSVRQAARVLQDSSADVVLGFGGYPALSAYLAAARLRVPVVVHEANAVPGIANRIGARLTRYVAVTAPDTPLPHATVVGVPVREAIATLDRAALRLPARRAFGLDPDRSTLLVFGGSQGARRINQAVFGAVDDLSSHGIQVLHVLGPDQDVPTRHDPAGAAPYVRRAYVDRMDLAYAAADLALCRAGAMSVAELSSVGLPSVFVPYPHSNQEQARNAAPMVQRGAALLVADDRFDASWITQHVRPLLLDPERLRTMAADARTSHPDDAAQRLVGLVAQAVRSKSP